MRFFQLTSIRFRIPDARQKYEGPGKTKWNPVRKTITGSNKQNDDTKDRRRDHTEPGPLVYLIAEDVGAILEDGDAELDGSPNR